MLMQRVIWRHLLFVSLFWIGVTAEVFVTNQSSSWIQAVESCFHDNSRLHIPTKESLHIPTNTFDDGVYWIGGVKSLIWKWTSNGSRLYDNIGYTSDQNSPHTITNNDVFECHKKCSSSRTFGLQNSNCYCLQDDVQLVNGTQLGARPCPGNLGEFCGNSQSISVYTIGDIGFNPTSGETAGQCVYARKVKGSGSNYYIELRPGNCDTKRAYVYKDENGRVAIEDATLRTWMEANTSASGNLLYVTPADLDELVSKKIYNTNENDRKREYWIGLKQKETALFTDGRVITSDYASRSEDNNPVKCLTVNLSENKYIWEGCSEQHKGICGTLQDTLKTSGSCLVMAKVAVLVACIATANWAMLE